MAAALSHQRVIAELARDTTLSAHQIDKVAKVIISARWGPRPRTRADHLATARRRQKGAGFASPFLTVSDEQLAQADTDIAWRLDLPGRAAAKAARDAEFGAAPFRLTAYGVERV
jgi:hypothetical protein